ncbi:5704_t:CDS:2, partial [Gigaspora rosea]
MLSELIKEKNYFKIDKPGVTKESDATKEPEATFIYYLRLAFIIILVMLVLPSITVLLFLNLIHEQPSISTTYRQVDEIPAPIKFCDEYVIQPNKMDIGDNQRLYVGKFLPKSNAIFYSQTPKIFLNMTINNKTKSQRLNIGMYAFDSEYDPWNKTFDDNFSRTLNFTNLHYLTPYQYHTFMYSRKVRKTLDNSFVNYIGYKNAYSSKYYIESSTQSSPLNLNYSYNIVIEINAQSFIMEENIEQ